MPSKSKSQQKLFGMVHKCQKTGECASPEVEKIADGIGKKDAKDFAKTKHKGLPNKVKKKKKKAKKGKFSDWLKSKKLEEVTMGQTGHQGTDRVNLGKLAVELRHAITNASGLDRHERMSGGIMPFEREELARLRDLINEIL